MLVSTTPRTPTSGRFLRTGAAPNAPGERRPTGTEPRKETEPTLWAVRSTGWFGAASVQGTLLPADSSCGALLACTAAAGHDGPRGVSASPLIAAPGSAIVPR